MTICERLLLGWILQNKNSVGTLEPKYSSVLAVNFHFLVRVAQYVEMGSGLTADFCDFFFQEFFYMLSLIPWAV